MTENNIGKFGEYDPNATPTEEEIAKAISHPVLTHLNKRLEELQTQNANLESVKQAQSDTILRLRDKWRTAEYSLESVLKELLDDEEISPENAQKIADIFDGITLTKQIEIEYTITATATVEVPYGSDPDDVANSTYVERVEFYTDFDGADVLESDHEAEDWRVR
jgi:predicted nuclease with TOPRIM domain